MGGRLLRVDIGDDTLQVLDVVFAVEGAHFVNTGPVWLVDVELLVEAIAKDELMGHFHSERLHRVSGSVVDRPDPCIVKVAHFLGRHPYSFCF